MSKVVQMFLTSLSKNIENLINQYILQCRLPRILKSHLERDDQNLRTHLKAQYKATINKMINF